MSNIINKSVIESYKDDMIRYSLTANLSRTIPNIHDSFKPVQRRILYSMYKLKAIGNKRFKSSKIVGDTMGDYHPHGDSSIYNTMMPLAAWFKAKVPLINGDGNWGNVMGDSPAAMRYTEATLSDFAVECIMEDLNNNDKVIDWSLNYNDSIYEPDYLPIKVPLLLINGCLGIGVGIQTNVPTHNLVEVINATLYLIDNPNGKVALVPDHCMPTQIVDTDWTTISDIGNGSYTVRGLIEIGEYQHHPALIITSLPNNVTTTKVVEDLNNAVLDGKIIDIKDIIDSSGGNELKIIVQLKKQVTDINYVKKLIYKHSSVESKYNVNFNVVDNDKLYNISYTEYLKQFIADRKMIIYRNFMNQQQILETRFHKIDAYIKILESGEIDKIIKLIRNSNGDDTELIEILINKIKLTDLQVSFILESTIKSLSMSRLNSLKSERDELFKRREYINNTLSDDKNVSKFMKDELRHIAKKYGTPRLSQVVTSFDAEEIPDIMFKVVITRDNNIRKLNINENVYVVKGDTPERMININNRDSLMLFSGNGRVYKLDVHKIPAINKDDPGFHISTFNNKLYGNIIEVMSLYNIENYLKDGYKLMTVSKYNNIKRLSLEDIITTPSSGLIYSRLSDDDYIVDIDVVRDDSVVVVYSNQQAITIRAGNIPLYHRTAKGVFAMQLDRNETICGMDRIYTPNQIDVAPNYYMILTNNGYINKILIESVPISDRNIKGSNVIKLSKDDSIYKIFAVNDNQRLIVERKDMVQEINISDIPLSTSVSKGNRFVKGIILKSYIL